ncbi:MAG: thioredoxin domain-containing protein [Bryobacteraceae bacterium]
MHTNKLTDEKSPYLQQHAHNPVNWYPWGPEAFEKARSEQKPIFLSIGYSTCHWCHVMERESFESEDLAAVLNEYFVPVKVDREERPDVDRIYMSFVQASTGSGGWPMSVFLTPDLKPFYGGTYFPPDNRYGRPGFKSILGQLAKSWHEDRERIVESSIGVVEQLKQYARVSSESKTIFDQAILDSCYFQYRRSFDSKLGGFGGAPKFPRPVTLNFLLRYFQRTKNEEAMDMVLFTLRAMAKGGMNDQLAGGFHRYSVDAHWFVPHFEKMLYDQGQLAVSYLEGFQVSGDEALAQVARDIFRYVQRDMTHPQGGFYSAEDADSVIDPAHPHEKGEGAFYVWTKAEIVEVLGPAEAERFCRRYGVEENGNVHEDPHQEFPGKNILFQARPAEGDHDEAIARLIARRNTRVRPHLDDKILTSWNGLMISAFAKGAQTLSDEQYLKAARGAADFILSTLYDGNILLRRFREGESAIPGFLDDYAFFAQALLDLYEACFDKRYFDLAVRLTDKMLELFRDPADGGFFSTAEGDASLVMRMKEDYDGAEPSGNSIAVLNLLRLSRLTGKDRYREEAERTLNAFGTRLKTAPTGVPQMMVAAQYSITPPKQIVLAGSDPAPFLAEIHKRFLPEHTVIVSKGSSAGELPPEVREMIAIDGKTTAYVCENFACQLPTTSVEKLIELLQ